MTTPENAITITPVRAGTLVNLPSVDGTGWRLRRVDVDGLYMANKEQAMFVSAADATEALATLRGMAD